MRNIADAMFEADEAAETGWTKPAKSLLVAALIVTSAKHGDFGKLEDVLQQSVTDILEDLENVPTTTLTGTTLRDLGPSERSTVRSVLVSRIESLLDSDLFDGSMERFSLREYYHDPQGVIVIDNIQGDRYARSLWRFFLESAIDFSFESAAQQYFIIDELDKLPKIPNVTNLASAGRGADSRGIFALQDIHQLRDSYGRLADSIYVNCPDRICFNPGDSESAEFALQSLGEYEVPATRVSRASRYGDTGPGRSTTNHTHQEIVPVMSSDLLQATPGEALVQSPHGWWLCDLRNPQW